MSSWHDTRLQRVSSFVVDGCTGCTAQGDRSHIRDI